MAATYSPAFLFRQGAIREQFVEHKRLEKTMAKLASDIQALEVPHSNSPFDQPPPPKLKPDVAVRAVGPRLLEAARLWHPERTWRVVHGNDEDFSSGLFRSAPTFNETSLVSHRLKLRPQNYRQKAMLCLEPDEWTIPA